jgi:glycosyltransferase involved in cell wall biosynthesis
MNRKLAFVAYGSGIGSYIEEACIWLAQRGYRIDILFPALGKTMYYPDWAAQANVTIHNLPVGNLHYYLAKLKSPLAFDVRKMEMGRAVSIALSSRGFYYDLVELLNGLSYSPKALATAPYVCKLHGAYWMMNHYCEIGKWSWRAVRSQRSLMLKARQIHALSRSQAAFISGACQIPPRLIDVMPLPINTQRFSPSETPALVPPYRIMCVGRLERHKGTHTLIAALPSVWQAEPNTHLFLYGSDGDFGKDQIERVLPPTQHQGRIHFEGLVPRDRLIDYYRQSHLYVLPTRYETFGYTILEAMACGCPVIASDVGGIAELVRHEETGWLVPRDDPDALAETILAALQQPKKREQYGRAAREHAKRYDVEVLMPRQIELYERALH